MPVHMMKAIRFHEFGAPEVLRYEDAPKPGLKPGEVLVRVRAVGVNPPDWYLREGNKMLPPEWRPLIALPTILGSDVSGVVEAVDADVPGFVVGNEVFGMVRFPSFGDSAEYVAAPASDLALKPAGIDHVQAAGAPMSLLTAWQFLIDVGHNHPHPVQSGPHRPVPLAGAAVLVNNAAGEVDHLAVQLAKWKGAHVIAVASGAHEAFLRSIGADEFIDYTKTAPEDGAHDIELVLDTLAGSTTGRFIRTIKRGGAFVPGVSPRLRRRRRCGEARRHAVSYAGSLGWRAACGDREAPRCRDNSRRVDGSFPLREARNAHERAAKGHTRGKIVLTVR